MQQMALVCRRFNGAAQKILLRAVFLREDGPGEKIQSTWKAMQKRQAGHIRHLHLENAGIHLEASADYTRLLSQPVDKPFFTTLAVLQLIKSEMAGLVSISFGRDWDPIWEAGRGLIRNYTLAAAVVEQAFTSCRLRELQVTSQPFTSAMLGVVSVCSGGVDPVES